MSKPTTKYEVEITKKYKGETETYDDTFYCDNLQELEDQINQHWYSYASYKVIDETPNEPEFRERGRDDDYHTI